MPCVPDQVHGGGGEGGETELARYTSAGVAQHVEAGLDDLRRAYAELHQDLASGGGGARPPEEQERIRQHVRALSLIDS